MITTIIIGLIFLIFVMSVCVCIYLLRKKKNYSRERFAFFSLLLVFSFASTILTHIFMNVSLINIFVTMFNFLPLDNLPIQATSWSDKLWSIVVFAMLLCFIIALYENWRSEGGLSEKDKELLNVNKKFGFCNAAYRGLSYATIPIVINKPEQSTKESYDLSCLDTPLDWHTEVKQLLELTSVQFKIANDSWYSEKNAYFAKYSQKTLLIYCTHTLPSIFQVESTIKYFKKIDQNFDMIVAYKNLKNSKKKKTVSDFDGTHIEYRSKEQLLTKLVDFKDYHKYLETMFCENEISEGDKKKLDDVYVESSGEIIDLKNNNLESVINNVEKHLKDWACSHKSDNQIALLGEYGQGKSVLSLKLAYSLMEENSKRIPIIIELRGKSPRNETMATIIAGWALRFSINVKAIQKLLEEGRLIIILEGFDELDMVGDKLRRLEHFKKLWEFARYKKSKVIITGRPNLFLNNIEAREYLNLNNDSSALFQVTAIHLKPFTRNKIKQALRHTSDEISEEILKIYDNGKSNSGFNDLISRPSTLYQTSVIWDSLDKNNLNSAKVLNEFINHAYRRQEEKLRTIGPTGIEPPVLTMKERNYFMIGIAVAMIKNNGYSNQIDQLKLAQIVSVLSSNIPPSVSRDHPTSIPLLERIKLNRDGRESIFNDVRASGILTRDLTGIDSFKFAHKSFLEFIFAKFTVGLIKKDEDEIIYNTISNSLNIEGQLFKLEYSSEVIGHITELLRPNIIDFNKETASELMHSINPKLAFLDKCLYRKFWGLSAIGYIFILSLASIIIFFYGASYASSNFFFSIAGLFMLIRWNHGFKKNLAQDNLPSYLIWLSVCKKSNFDPNSCKLLSRNMTEYFSNSFHGITKLINTTFTMQLQFKKRFKSLNKLK